ncbi:MAG: hypothetical protein ACYTBV_10325 [Planctomycetota bacterium]|jgi:hypothetical protein
MNCVFDWCILWSNLFLGIVSSIAATVITFFCVYDRNRKRDRKKFSKAEGEYQSFKGDTNELMGKASIKYEGGNRLRIELTHDKKPRTWKGLITMDNEHYGTLGFQYTDNEKEFGFKRCIITDDGEKMCLIPEDPQAGYCKEILIRKK